MRVLLRASSVAACVRACRSDEIGREELTLPLLRGLGTSVRAVFPIPRLLLQRWEISVSQAVVRPSLRLLRTCKEICHSVIHTCPLPELLWLLTTGLVSQSGSSDAATAVIACRQNRH